MLCIHALEASLSLILEVGIDAIEQRLQQNIQLMLERIHNKDQLQVLSPSRLERLAGIVTFKHRESPSHEVFEQLKQHNIFCAERGGGIRFSPHFYTDPEKIAHAIDCAAGQ
jgi:selenocysteine lyase/cysteine desulfurase